MVSSKLLELESSIKGLSLDEKLWLLEKIVGQMRESKKSGNFQQDSNLESTSENINSEADGLIGLFSASPDLATNSEEILQNEITEKSGWSCKEKSV